MNDTERAIMETTINIVAEKGFDGFSTRQIAKELNISHTNIYAYFGSKEDLLIHCFHKVNKEIASVLDGLSFDASADMSTMYEALHECWKKYFEFMVRNNKHSLFYYAFRESIYLPKVFMRNSEESKQEMLGFMSEIAKIIPEQKNPDILWAYILDCTGVFVKHILRGNASFDEEIKEQIWGLISRGLCGVFV